MTRVGPNQDINNPTTMLEVGKSFYDKSVDFGNLLAKSDEEDPSATGPPVTSIIIPLKLEDGSIYDLDCSRITPEFTVNESNLAKSVINTYIDLAEKFRGYWETLRLSILSLNDFESVNESDIDSIPSGALPGALTGYTSGSLGGIQYESIETIFSISAIDTPVWSGDGPINYNYNTYPQLLNALEQLQASQGTFSTFVDEIYYWTNVQQKLINPPPLNTRTIVWAADGFVKVNGVLTAIGAIQIPNFDNDDNRIVNLTGLASYNRVIPSGGFFSHDEHVGITSSVAIDYHNRIFSLLTFVDETELISVSGGFYPGPNDSVNLSISHDREIIIPPNRSAFIIFTSDSRGDIERGILPGSITATCSVVIDAGTYNNERSTSLSMSF